VAGQAASLTGVTVQNATLKAGASWADNGDGTYTTTYVAQTTGTGLKASLTLSGSSVQSVAYTITAGAAVAANSAIVTDSSSYASGDDMTITVTLKDSVSNIVTGQATSLTDVTVQNATLKPGASWTDNGDGTYTTTYVAQTVGTGLKAGLTLDDSSVQSVAYAIEIPVSITRVLVNGYTFAPDAGFPTTGFHGAVFKLVLSNSRSQDFTWTANLSTATVTVANGTVYLNSTASGAPITITATPKSGGGAPITYTFQLTKWFGTILGAAPLYLTQTEALTSCGGTLPSMSELVGPTAGHRGDIGGLWSEWGPMSAYSTFTAAVGSTSMLVWSSDFTTDNHRRAASLATGDFFSAELGSNMGVFATCMTNL